MTFIADRRTISWHLRKIFSVRSHQKTTKCFFSKHTNILFNSIQRIKNRIFTYVITFIDIQLGSLSVGLTTLGLILGNLNKVCFNGEIIDCKVLLKNVLNSELQIIKICLTFFAN